LQIIKKGGAVQGKTKMNLMKELHRVQEQDKTLRHQLRDLMKNLEGLNNKLQESESLKSSFLSNVRNEINNPLTSIMGLSEQIMNGVNLEFDSIMHRALMIYSEAFDLDFQLRNIFVAAELEAGEAIPSTASVDVDALIRNTIDSFRHKANKKEISIHYSYMSIYETETRNLLKTDPEKLKLILSNLLSNAIEFSDDRGSVKLIAKRDNKYLVFSVKDTGIGIDEEDQTVIFDRFRQLETGMTRTHGGHGLGLSITRDLVALLGGTISVVSTKGNGSIFTVSISEAEVPVEVDAFSDDGNILVF
jgi:signal transduction histidine kinase